MRDYLYLWNDAERRRLVVSGMEFRDLVPELADGVVLLRYQFAEAAFEPASRFEFVPGEALAELAADDIHGYGDFVWAEIGRGAKLGALTDQAIAELAFFGQMARPLRDVEIPGLGNRFLCWAHDDGWYARVFYREWPAMERVLGQMLGQLVDGDLAAGVLERVGRGEAVWCQRDAVIGCERSEDIDALQGKYLTRRRR